MQHLKRFWALYAHSAVLLLVAFLDPSVRAWTHAHADQAILGIAWSYVLHLLKSPLGQ